MSRFHGVYRKSLLLIVMIALLVLIIGPQAGSHIPLLPVFDCPSSIQPFGLCTFDGGLILTGEPGLGTTLRAEGLTAILGEGGDIGVQGNSIALHGVGVAGLNHEVFGVGVEGGSNQGTGVRGWSETGLGGEFVGAKGLMVTGTETYGIHAINENFDINDAAIFAEAPGAAKAIWAVGHSVGVFAQSALTAVRAQGGDIGVAAYGIDFGVTGRNSSPVGAGIWGSSEAGTAVLGLSQSGQYIFEGFDNSLDQRRFAVERATGNVLADGSYTGPADFAEMLPASGSQSEYEPGDMLVIGPDGKVAKSMEPNSGALVGVFSDKPGFVGDIRIAEHGIESYENSKAQPDGELWLAVALVGVVPVKVISENGAIHPGDLLTTSSTPGHAMRAEPVDINGVTIYPMGSILGKALETLEADSGLIKVLLMLR